MSISGVMRTVSSAILYGLLSGPLVAQPITPSISLTSPAAAVSETDQSSITLMGSATTVNRLANVRWVDQSGHRGSGAWAETAARTATWTIANIPLRLGVNHITVTAVDAANGSKSVHLAVIRKPVPGTLPKPALKSGTVVEGDIILNPSTGPAAARAQKSAAGIIMTPDGLATASPSNLWPLVGGVHQVPYIVTNGPNADLDAAISAFNTTFAGVIHWVPRAAETNYVNISIDIGGSDEGFATIGMAGGEQTLECGSGCTLPVWFHEMGHSVGLYHEQSRPDRANYITVNPANADLIFAGGNSTTVSDALTLGLYDYASIMEYGAFEFGENGLPVIETIPAGIPLGNDAGVYSAGDIDGIKRLYGAIPSQVTVTTNPTGLQIIVDGTTYTAPQVFTWALNSNHTLALPADPQLTSPADGSTYAFGNWNDLGARSHTISVRGGSGSLTAPANAPAVTMYEASFIRLQPLTYTVGNGSGTISAIPAPTAEYGGTFYTDRTRVQLNVTPDAGYQFDDWFQLDFPTGAPLYTFNIQAPTNAEAWLVPTSTAVTQIGESITGPNTWNVGGADVTATVDGSSTLLPATFDTSAWTTGSFHTVTAPQTQGAWTSDSYLNWNSWSDGGSISHTVTQPGSGFQSITGSFTPFYALDPVPAAGGSCGGVTLFPAGTAYSGNTSYNFIQDGTGVTATATPNAGAAFGGWSGGSLSGTTNPQAMTVNNPFVPTAIFNLTAAPLAITSLSPSRAVVSATGALDVTINGTGFTNSSTVFWAGNSRASTFVSSTQLILHLTPGDLANAGGQSVSVSNSSGGCSVNFYTVFTVNLTAPADGYADILWHNTSGAMVIWFMNGATISLKSGVSGAPTPWTIVGTGDFNGDGKLDSLWRNTTNGQVEIRFMNGPTISSVVNLGAVPTAWTIVGTGDFNGDGKSDILWRNTSGAMVIWFMNGGTVSLKSGVRGAPTPWTFSGTGDFNGDGKSDILWRNTTNGQVEIWFMNGPTISSAVNLGAVPTAWTIVGTGDFNGDGKSDILWRNTSGAMVIWFMNGGTVSLKSGVRGAPTPWTFSGTGDFNGDGKSDILWRNTTNGQVEIWFMNGPTISSAVNLGAVPTSWTIVQ